MSLLEDVFAVEDNDDNDLERVIDNNSAEGSGADSNDDRNDHSEAEEEAPRKVEPPGEKKVRVVRNPRAVLNPRRLTGPRGISTIEKFFSDFKFAGKGHEKEDLDMVMKRLEHWAHRLYPRFQFEDCIDKIATLGAKKEVDVHIRRIRMNMLLDDVPIVQQDSDDEIAEPPGGPQLDEFDLLLDQQIALARSTPAHPKNLPFESPMQRAANDAFFTTNTGNIGTSAPVHSREIRQMRAQHLYTVDTRRMRTGRFYDSFLCSTAPLWNDLPASVFPPSYNRFTPSYPLKDPPHSIPKDDSPATLPVTSTPVRENLQTKTSSPQMNEEQKARMLKNRMIAEERRLLRMKQNMIKEKEASSEGIQTPDNPAASEASSMVEADDVIQIDTGHLKTIGESLKRSSPVAVEPSASDMEVG